MADCEFANMFTAHDAIMFTGLCVVLFHLFVRGEHVQLVVHLENTCVIASD